MSTGEKIAIVGTAPSSRAEAPYDDLSWEIWGLSQTPDLPRIDRWFELHNIERKLRKDREYLKQLQHANYPVMVTRAGSGLPTEEVYPWQEIFAAHRRYYRSQVDLMISLGLLWGAKEIGLWGIDMAQNTEYAFERPSCEYWLGYCEGRGVKIHVPVVSPLLKARGVYAHDDAMDEMAALHACRENELQERFVACRDQVEQCRASVFMLSGAMREVESLIASADNGYVDALTARKFELEEQAKIAVKAKNEAENNVHVVMGAQENMKWLKQGF